MKQNKIPVPAGRLSESKSRPSVSIDERVDSPAPPNDIIEQMARKPSQIPRKHSLASHLPRRKDSESLSSKIHAPSLLKRPKVDDKVSWKDRIMGKRGSESRSKSKDLKVPPLVDISDRDRRLIPDDVPPPGVHMHADHIPGSSPTPRAIPKPGTPGSGRSSAGRSSLGKSGHGNSGTRRPNTGIPSISIPPPSVSNAAMPSIDVSSPIEEKGRTLTVRNPSYPDTPSVQDMVKEDTTEHEGAEQKLQQKPTEEPEEQPEEHPEQQPEQQPEQHPEQQPEQQPDVKPEVEPEEEPEKTAVQMLEQILDQIRDQKSQQQQPEYRPEDEAEKSEEGLEDVPEERLKEEAEEMKEYSVKDQTRTKRMSTVDERLHGMESIFDKLRETGNPLAPPKHEEPTVLTPVQEIENVLEDEHDIEEEDPWHLEGSVSSNASLKKDMSPEASPVVPQEAPAASKPPPVASNNVSRMSDSSNGSVASSLQSFLGDDVELNLDDDDSDKDDDHHVHTEECDLEECFHHRENHTSWNWAIPPTPPIALQPAPLPRPSIGISQPPSRSGSTASQPASGIPHKVAAALKANAVSMRRPSRPDNPWSWKLPAPDPSAPKLNTVMVRRPSRLDHNTNSFGVWKSSSLSPTTSRTNTVVVQRPSIPGNQAWEPSPSPMTTTFPRHITHDSPTLNELSRAQESRKSNGSIMSNGSAMSNGASAANRSSASNGSPVVQRTSLSNVFEKPNESPSLNTEFSKSNESLLSEYSNLEEFSRLDQSSSNNFTTSNKSSGFSRVSDSPTLSDPPRFSAASMTSAPPKPVEVPRPNQQPEKPWQPPKLDYPPPRPAPPSPLQQDVLEMMGKQMLRRPSRPEDALNSHPVHVRQDSAIDLCRLCHSGVAESWGVCQKCEEMTPAALQPFSGGITEKKERDSKQFRPPPIDVARSRNMSTYSYTSSIGSDLTTPTTGSSSTTGDMPHRLRPSLAENIIDEAALMEAMSPPMSPICHNVEVDEIAPSDFEDAGNPFDMSPDERDRFEDISPKTSNDFEAAPETDNNSDVAPDDQSHYDISPGASGDNYDIAPDDTSHYDGSPNPQDRFSLPQDRFSLPPDRFSLPPDSKNTLEIPSAAGSNFEISTTAGARTSTLPALPTPDVLARYRLDADRTDRGSREKDDSKDEKDVYEDDWADYYFDAENFEAAKNRPRTKSAQTREAAQGYMARELSLDEYDGLWEKPMSPGPGWI